MNDVIFALKFPKIVQILMIYVKYFNEGESPDCFYFRNVPYGQHVWVANNDISLIMIVCDPPPLIGLTVSCDVL